MKSDCNPMWSDVRAALDARGFAGVQIHDQGRILADVIATVQHVMQAHIASGALDTAPLIEARFIDAPNGGQGIGLFVRGDDEPRWTT